MTAGKEGGSLFNGAQTFLRPLTPLCTSIWNVLSVWQTPTNQKRSNPSSIPLGILNNFKAPYFLNTGIVYLDACFLLLD